jgi:hypothetical protein
MNCHPAAPHGRRITRAWGRHAQELVQDRLGRVPCVGSRPLVFEPFTGDGMERRVRVGRVDHQNVRVDRRRLPPFQGLVQGLAIRHIDQGAAAMERRE